jgi:hypothetical protein
MSTTAIAAEAVSQAIALPAAVVNLRNPDHASTRLNTPLEPPRREEQQDPDDQRGDIDDLPRPRWTRDDEHENDERPAA